MYIHRHPWTSRENPWTTWSLWFPHIYMYFGYTLYPWLSRDIPWMPCTTVLRIYNVSMDIPRYSMDALLVCTTVLRIYIVSMDIQRYSMDTLLVCTTVLRIYIVSMDPEILHTWLGGTHYCTYTCTSAIHCVHEYPYMAWWYTLLYMYMYFGYTLYP